MAFEMLMTTIMRRVSRRTKCSIAFSKICPVGLRPVGGVLYRNQEVTILYPSA